MESLHRPVRMAEATMKSVSTPAVLHFRECSRYQIDGNSCMAFTSLIGGKSCGQHAPPHVCLAINAF